MLKPKTIVKWFLRWLMVSGFVLFLQYSAATYALDKPMPIGWDAVLVSVVASAVLCSGWVVWEE